MEYRKHKCVLRQFIAGPIIYLTGVPLVLLDVLLALYQYTVFPLLSIPRVRRSQYIRIDRHKLSYLTVWEKVNCAFCGYANGVIMYAMRIAGETERYWCGIKHRDDPTFTPPPHHKFFLPYGDEEKFKEFINQ